jgi:hypothetical protein
MSKGKQLLGGIDLPGGPCPKHPAWQPARGSFGCPFCDADADVDAIAAIKDYLKSKPKRHNAPLEIP